MRVEMLKHDRIDDFVAYCKKHRSEVDESFLYDDELMKFTPDENNPTYVVLNQQEEIVAAASLIADEYNRKGKKARFRIFHSELDDFACYEMLMQATLKHTDGLDNVFLFVPIVNENLMANIEKLKFAVDRYSYLLVCENLEVPAASFPEPYRIRAFKPGSDEETWCEVRNAAFATLRGSETPITPERVTKMTSSDSYLEGGMMILFHEDKPVGVVRCADDEFEDSPIMNIGPLAILPEYQGKGLGRSLLRASMHFAKEKNYNKTILCVNADNDRAKALYLQEGFVQVEAVACYEYDLTGN